MVHIHEFDPRDIDDDNYDGMPELCDSEPSEKVKTDPVKNDGGEGDSDIQDTPRPVDEDGFEDVLGSGRLRKKILEEGDKERGRPPRNSCVRINLIERLDSGIEVAKETDYEFNVGESEVISGLDLVTPLMYPGEKALVTVEPSFGYGANGDRDRVPKNANLELEVELIEWSELGPVPDIDRPRRMEIGSRKRERGNKHFSRGEYSMAIQCYRKAVEYLDDKQIEDDMEVPIDRFLLPKDLQSMLEERVKTFNNMTQAQMKLTAWDSALSSARQVLKIEPNNEKALFRKAKVLIEKCQLDEAIGILRRVNRLYPSNKECQAELARLTSKVKAGKQKEQLMSRKMLGLDKLPPPSPQSNFYSKSVKIGLAALGGIGALAATYLMKQYNLY